MSGRPQPGIRTSRTVADTAWHDRAACVGADPEAFFPSEKMRITKAVRRICASCEVQSDCLEHALTHGEWYGVWGGCSADERRRLARKAVRA